MAIGDIGSVIDTEVWKAADPGLLFITHVTGTIYIISNNTSSFVLRTISIGADGSIGSVIDSLTLDAGLTSNAKDIVHISGDVYAVAYAGSSQVVVQTFTCDSSGNLGAAAIDTINLAATPPTYKSFLPHLIPSHVANIYIVAYTDSVDDGWLATVRINNDGSIDEPVLSSTEIETDRGKMPWLINISGNLFAVVIGSTASNRSRTRTFTVSDVGAIGGLDEALFDGATNSGNGGIILHVSGDVYAIFWQGADLDGWIYTLSIDGSGNISANIDTWEFVTSYCHLPHAMRVSENQAANGQIFVVVFSQTGVNGPGVFTVEILNNGTITKSFIDTLTLIAANYAHDVSIVRPGNGIYAAAYRNLTGAYTGEMKSFSVEEKSRFGVGGLVPMMEIMLG